MTATATVSVAASGPLPFKAAADTALPNGSQWGLALLVCCAALALLLWWLRSRGAVSSAWPRGRLARVEVLEAHALGPQTRLVVARYGGRQLLLSVGPAGTQCLRDDDIATEQAT